jgi:hypothetical protein
MRIVVTVVQDAKSGDCTTHLLCPKDFRVVRRVLWEGLSAGQVARGPVVFRLQKARSNNQMGKVDPAHANAIRPGKWPASIGSMTQIAHMIDRPAMAAQYGRFALRERRNRRNAV